MRCPTAFRGPVDTVPSIVCHRPLLFNGRIYDPRSLWRVWAKKQGCELLQCRINIDNVEM
jgi:hypothetical protein